MDHTVTFLVGLPGQGMHLGLDPLSLLWLCLLAPALLAYGIAGMARSAAFWALVAGMALTVLAADVFTLILGFGLMNAAAWLLLQSDPAAAPARAVLSLLAALALLAAVFLPPGSAAFLLLLLATAATAWPTPATALAPGPPRSVTGGMVLVMLYVLVRYGFVVFGSAAQPWWGVLLIGLGAAALLVGALRAMLEAEMKALLNGVAAAQLGLAAISLGIALWAGPASPALAALALQAALLWAVALALIPPLLLLGAATVGAMTGTTSLDWLGGLLRGMPRLGLLMVMGATGMAVLPLSPAFAAAFLLLHAVLAAASGGVGTGLGFAILLTALGLGAGLLFAAAIRLIGIGFLGRPRSLRAAAAEEAPRPVLIAMALLAACCLLPALLPGQLLAAMQPALAVLAPDAPVLKLPYAPLPLVLLLLALSGAAWAGLRRFGRRREREVRPFNGGFGQPPIWLPFGDPATQSTGSGFAASLRRLLPPVPTFNPPAVPRSLAALARRPAFRRAGLRPQLAVGLAILSLFLLALGLASQ